MIWVRTEAIKLYVKAESTEDLEAMDNERFLGTVTSLKLALPIKCAIDAERWLS